MDIDCPECGFNIEFDTGDLPDKACDDKLIECPACLEEFYVGWYATAELR